MVDASGTWAIMDTVGMAQMDLPDVEAAFPQDKHERFPAVEVEAFLRNQSLRLLYDPTAFESPIALPGPGGVLWRSSGLMASGHYGPPRTMIRFLPRTLLRPPRILRTA